MASLLRFEILRGGGIVDEEAPRIGKFVVVRSPGSKIQNG